LLSPARDENGRDGVQDHPCDDDDRELPFLELDDEEDANSEAFQEGRYQIETEIGHLCVRGERGVILKCQLHLFLDP
jgi:hypothetical protein